MLDKAPHGYKYFPGPIKQTEQDWQDFLADNQGAASSVPPVHFIPSVGGCFVVIQGDQAAASSVGPFCTKTSRALIDDFWRWLQKRRPLVPQGRSVMVVDDDKAVLKLLKIVLETSGYNVRGFGDATVALDSIDQTAPPDVLLVDLRMPGMDGRSFVGEVRAMELESKVIIVSGHDAEIAAAELGADGAVSKPFVPDDLIALVKTLTLAA